MATALVIKKEEAGVVLSKVDVITLNAAKRKVLIKMVPEIIDMSKEQEAYDTLKATVTTELTAFLKAQFPEEDLVVLRKYNSIRTTRNVTIIYKKESSTYYSEVGEFEVGEIEYPDGYRDYGSSNSNSCLWRAPEGLLLEKCKQLKTLKEQLKFIKAKKIASYVSIINGSKTLNQVATVWEDVADYLKGEMPAKVAIVNQITEEEINTVKEDVSRRVKEEN